MIIIYSMFNSPTLGSAALKEATADKTGIHMQRRHGHAAHMLKIEIKAWTCDRMQVQRSMLTRSSKPLCFDLGGTARPVLSIMDLIVIVIVFSRGTAHVRGEGEAWRRRGNSWRRGGRWWRWRRRCRNWWR